MLEKILFGPVGRALRAGLAGLLAKLLLVPAISKVPGASEFLSNPELSNYVVIAVLGLIMGLAKSLRDSGRLPKWVPL